MSRRRPEDRDSSAGLLEALRQFAQFGAATRESEEAGLRYFHNEYWTARQRQGHSLHEISYRACFKPQLPQFFIERLTRSGERVYDPFSGRGTTALQAWLTGRAVAANDVNPLSAMLLRPRLAAPDLAAIAARLQSIDLEAGRPVTAHELLAFFHPLTLRAIENLRDHLDRRTLDPVDDWIRMVSLNRLTGHSPGFFSVYTLPPNQAASVASQRRINAARRQVPPPRDVRAIILRKSRRLLRDPAPAAGPGLMLLTGRAEATPSLRDGSVALVVTSPPFLDVVDYAGDNWLRCWFAGIDPVAVPLDRHDGIAGWEAFIRRTFAELARVVRPGGWVVFEVGEVRGGRVLLERHVALAIAGLPFRVAGVMVNRQAFTKTANCWGVANNTAGTNTNRVVLCQRLGA